MTHYNNKEIRQFTNNNIYTCAEVLTIINRVQCARSIEIVKHKYMLMCNHKIRKNIMRCLTNSTVRREIGQYASFGANTIQTIV